MTIQYCTYITLLKIFRAVFCEAFKKKVYGDRFQWLIVGMYEAAWWSRDQAGLDCSPTEVEGYLRGQK